MKETLEAVFNRVLNKQDLHVDEYNALVHLRSHVGASNALLREDLAALMYVSVRTVRAVVKKLIEEHQIPIAASQSGYYIIQTEVERRRAKLDLLSRARSLEHRALALDAIQLSA
jgi:transcriptional antiterminator